MADSLRKLIPQRLRAQILEALDGVSRGDCVTLGAYAERQLEAVATASYLQGFADGRHAGMEQVRSERLAELRQWEGERADRDFPFTDARRNQ